MKEENGGKDIFQNIELKYENFGKFTTNLYDCIQILKTDEATEF